MSFTTALRRSGVNARVCLDLIPRADERRSVPQAAPTTSAAGSFCACSGIRDRVEGLDEGADDYLVKPFAFSELAARIRAVSRREGSMREPVLATRGLELDPNTNRARRDEVEIHLTPKEFALLYYLVKNEGRAVPLSAPPLALIHRRRACERLRLGAPL